MGDIVVTSPVVRWLKLQLNAELHFLVKSKFKEIIEFNPYIDQIKLYGNDVKVLKNEQYDLVVDLHKSRASIKVRWTLGVKSLSYQKLNVRKWLLTHLKINTLPDIHLVDRYEAALLSLHIKNDGKGLDFFINPDTFFPQEIPIEYDVIVLGAAHATKRITVEIAAKIIENSKSCVVLLGGKDVTDQGIVLSKTASNVINYCGKTDLHTSAIILEKAKHIFTGDTGLMHISAALKKNMTVFWGSTAPIIGMYPYVGENKDTVVIHKILNLWCQPCSKIGYDKCPLGHFKCMKNQSVDKFL